MTLAERLPSLDDRELANLHANALRLQAGDGKRVGEATELLPLIEQELAQRLAQRLAAKPPKAARKRSAAA